MSFSTKIAYVFPGQGSQWVGMGFDLYNSCSAARKVFHEADAVLGFSLSRLCFEGPEDELIKTVNVQPAILVTSIACLRAAQEASNEDLPPPAFVAGHSSGEYAALVAAEAIDFADAVHLIWERGRLMQEAGEKNQGGMLAIIGLDREVVVEICLQSGCEISNINSPVQIVISGSIGALAKANNLAKMRGTCRSIPLKVNGAFHSALMEPVMDEFSQIISKSTFHPPGVPIIANVAAEPMNDIDSIKEELIRQLRCCIQWQRSIEYIVYKGVNTFCEVGPGKVLSGLIKRINSEAQTFNISSADSVRQLANLNIEHRT